MASRKRNGRPGSERWHDIKGGMAFIIPVALIKHESYRLLTPWAHKLLADLSQQYGGYNNGYLSASWTAMEGRGWNSRTTLAKATAELEHYGILERTQQGGRNRPNRFAFSWRRIDRIDGYSLDVAATMQPSNAWEAARPPFAYTPRARKCYPSDGQVEELQAHEVDSICPLTGLGNED